MASASKSRRRRHAGRKGAALAPMSTDDIFAMNEFVFQEMEMQAALYQADPLLIRSHIQELRDVHIEKSKNLDAILAALQASAADKIEGLKKTFHDKWRAAPNSQDRQLAEMEINCHITQIHATTNLTMMNMSQSVQKKQLDNALTTMTRLLESAFLFNDQTQKRLDAGKKEMDDLVHRHKTAIEASRVRCDILEERIAAIELEHKVGGTALSKHASTAKKLPGRQHRPSARMRARSRNTSPAVGIVTAALSRGGSRATSIGSCASKTSVHDQITAAQDTAYARATSAGRYWDDMWVPPRSAPMPKLAPATIPVPVLPVYFTPGAFAGVAHVTCTEDTWEIRTAGSE